MTGPNLSKRQGKLFTASVSLFVLGVWLTVGDSIAQALADWMQPVGGWRNGSAVFDDTPYEMKFEDISELLNLGHSPPDEMKAWSCKSPFGNRELDDEGSPNPDCDVSEVGSEAQWYFGGNTDMGNIQGEDCSPPTSSCIAFQVREEGCETIAPDRDHNAKDGKNAGAALINYVRIPVPTNNHINSYKIWFDTRCTMVNEDGEPQGVGCDEIEEGVANRWGHSPVRLEVYCHEPYYSSSDPMEGGGDPDVAVYDLPVYNEFSRFEAEFYAPPDKCRSAEGTPESAEETPEPSEPMIALQIRVMNDDDGFENVECNDSTEPPTNALFRSVEIKDINLRPIYFNADEWEKGLADYQWLASMTPLPDCIEGQDCFEPVAGCVSVDPDVPGVLMRISKAETLGTPDVEMDCLGLPEKSGASTIATGVQARELWHAPAVAWDDTPPYYEGSRAEPSFFLTDRPDDVRPWTLAPWTESDTLEQQCLPGQPMRFYFGIVVGDPDAAHSLALHVPEDDWRVYSVVYEPVPVDTQYWTEAEVPHASTGFDGAYEIKPALLLECRANSGDSADPFMRYCDTPFWPESSRSMVLEIPDGSTSDFCNPSGSYSMALYEYPDTNRDDLTCLDTLYLKFDPQFGMTSRPPASPKIIMWDALPKDDYINFADEFDELSEETRNALDFLAKYGHTHIQANFGYWWYDDAGSYEYRTNPEYKSSTLEAYDLAIRLTALNINLVTDPASQGKSLSFTADAKKATYIVSGGRGKHENVVGVLENYAYPANDIRRLGKGDYVTCSTSKPTSALARIGLDQGDRYILDVPFRGGTCTGDGTKFYAVFNEGQLDKQILEAIGYPFDNDKEHPTNFHQGEYCPQFCPTYPDNLCNGLFPLTCDRPMVAEMSSSDVTDPSSATDQYEIDIRCWDYDYEAGGRPIRTGTCGVQSTLTEEQKDFLRDGSGENGYPGVLSSIRDLDSMSNDGSQPRPILVPANMYDETKSFGSLTGLFDGFGLVSLDSLGRFLQTEGGLEEIDGNAAPQWDVFMNVTDDFMAFWHLRSRIHDSDGDGTKDISDFCPFSAINTLYSCDDRGPFFDDQMENGVSEYINRTHNELLSEMYRQFAYAGGYHWGVRNPARSRAHGVLWRKAASERGLERTTLPNLLLHPGGFSFRYKEWNLRFSSDSAAPSFIDAIGTWDSFALLDPALIESATPPEQPLISTELPFLLSDANGSYAGWDGQIDAVIHSAVLELENDARLLVERHFNFPAADIFPYGSRWYLQNRAESVCTLNKLAEGYFGPYENIAQACRDYITTPGARSSSNHNGKNRRQ